MLRTHWMPTLLAALAYAATVQADVPALGEARGVIASVDAAEGELSLEGRGAARGVALSFVLDDKTLVLFGATKATAADLRPGRRVRVEFEVAADGQRIARVVRAIGRPPAATPVAAAPAVVAPTGDAVTGVLQRVARSDREVVVIGPGAKGPETETTVSVPDGVKIVKEGKPAILESLKEGDTVAIRVERKGGLLNAIEVQAGAGAALSASPAPERGRMVPRLRQALHLADEVLRRMDPAEGDRGNEKKP